MLWAPGNLGEDVVRYEWERRSQPARPGEPSAWDALDATPTFYLSDEGLEPGATYEYRVRAVDAAARVSGPSAPLSVTLPPSSTWSRREYVRATVS